MSKANEQVAGAEVFAFNYDLATTPPATPTIWLKPKRSPPRFSGN